MACDAEISSSRRLSFRIGPFARIVKRGVTLERGCEAGGLFVVRLYSNLASSADCCSWRKVPAVSGKRAISNQWLVAEGLHHHAWWPHEPHDHEAAHLEGTPDLCKHRQ